jgi:hypothetical protein
MLGKQAQKKAIYLNNDHGMLENGLFLMKSFLQKQRDSQLHVQGLSEEFNFD